MSRTVFEKIISAIRPFGFPYAPDIYDGRSEHYFTYNYADNRAGLHGDDSPETVIAYMQIHLFMPRDEDFIKIKNAVRKALHIQGFTYPEVTISLENDTNKRHIIFECEIEEEMEDIELWHM